MTQHSHMVAQSRWFTRSLFPFAGTLFAIFALPSTSEAQCDSSFPVYCAATDTCWESGTDCSSIRYCGGEATACRRGYRVDCSLPAGLRCEPDDDGGSGVSGTLCSNTCTYAFDGECDDGGWGSEYSLCSIGTDCGDCGTRYVADDGTTCSASELTGSAPALYPLAIWLFARLGRRRRR